MALTLDSPITLPCGLVLPNRIAKTAIGEGLADLNNQASDDHLKLYRHWGQGGAGLIITGAIQVDRRYLDRPGDLVLDGPQPMSAKTALAALVAEGKGDGAAIIAQLSHAGGQAIAAPGQAMVGPSARQVRTQDKRAIRALNVAEIDDIVHRFVFAAGVAIECGFDGIQLLAGQGRLLGAFLDPACNRRDDTWGGDIGGRAKLLIDIVRAIRLAYGPRPALSVKFGGPQDGLDETAIQFIAAHLLKEGVDLIELSHGVYGLDRSARGASEASADSAAVRKIARSVRASSRMPVLIGGGRHNRAALEQTLAEGGADMVGFGRVFCVNPAFAHDLMDGPAEFAADDLIAHCAPERGAINRMVNRLEHAAGLHERAVPAWCALAILDIVRGNAVQRRSAQAALAEFQRNEKIAARSFAA